ncbi:MAG: AAA family ATPase [Persicimonas sp.]
MSHQIPGFELQERLYESPRTLVYRAWQPEEQRSVVLKILHSRYPSTRELVRYRHEYDVASHLCGPGIIRVHGLRKHLHGLLLIVEDFGGDSLAQVLERHHFGLNQFLDLALQLVASIEQVHEQGVIHRDINPANTVWNETSGKLKLIDFGLSATYSEEVSGADPGAESVGTLPYISPEQTGRTRRVIDYRSDFYSLGATLYELLTGHLIFEARDAAQWMHQHLARVPAPPHKVCADVPKMVSKIIMKLLAKPAEDRYQSAHGLRADLEECKRRWVEDGRIDDFDLAAEDVRATLHISQRLYGREAEVEQMLDAFEQARLGGRRLVLVSGSAGVGKSALVQDIQRPITGSNGWFTRGKFDQHKRDVPYSAFTDAFDTLLEFMLAGEDDEIARWGDDLDEALGSDAGLLTDLLPHLQVLLGARPAPAELSSSEARRRFHRAFCALTDLVCRTRCPLTLFVDDLQWADDASLDLLDRLLADESIEGLLVVGTYRDDEVDATHPLTETIHAIDESTTPVIRIPLGPLSSNDIDSLLSDTLQRPRAEVHQLARLIERKTSGNPYFLRRVLINLDDTGLLWFDTAAGQWQWDLRRIETRQLSENVVELLVTRLNTFGDKTQQALRFAALLGGQFDLNSLSLVCESSPVEVFEHLRVVLKEGILVRRSLPDLSVADDPESPVVVKHMAFAHDRLQQAAAQLWPEDQRSRAHLKVGRLLEVELRDRPSTSRLFSVVGHLNAARDLIEAPTERLALAELNLNAARRARQTMALAEATHCLTIAAQLLPDDIWQTNPDLAFTTELARAEAEVTIGRLERAEALATQTLEKVNEPARRAELLRVLLLSYSYKAQFERACEIAQQALALLGVDFPLSDLDRALRVEFAHVQQELSDRSIEEVADLPRVERADADTALRVLSALHTAAGLTDQRRLLLVGLKCMRLTLEVGVRPESVPGLAVYGFNLCLQAQYDRGLKAGRLALRLAQRFDRLSDLAHAAFFFAGMIMPWSEPLRETLAIFEQAHRAGVRSGNWQFGGYGLVFTANYSFFSGIELTEVRRLAAESVVFGKRTGNVVAEDLGRSLRLVARNLAGLTEDSESFSDEACDSDAAFLDQCWEHNDRAVVVSFRVARAQVHCVFGRFARAIDDLEAIEDALDAALGTFDTARHTFYMALALSGQCDSASSERRDAYRRKLEGLRDTLARWAASCPENFAHKQLLIDAEWARISGAKAEAVDLYDAAITAAREAQFIHIEALANERAACFWEERGKSDIARIYQREAHYAYRRWGATRKLEQLEADYGPLSERGKPESAVTSSADPSGQIDVDSVFKAAESIAAEIELDALLRTLMQVTLENAGAQRGAFFLVEDGELGLAVRSEPNGRPVLLDERPPLREWADGPRSVVRYVRRTAESIVVGRASRDPRFQDDPYIRTHPIKSLLCIPVAQTGRLLGILYAENNLVEDAFSETQLRVLRILAGHIAASLDKARLYDELKEKEEQFRQLAENVQEAFWLMDWPSQQIVYISPAYTTIWGRPVPPGPLEVDQWLEPTVAEHRHRVTAALRHKAATGEYDEVYQIERPSGSRRWVHDRGFPVRTSEGEVERIAGVAADITNQHEVEQMKDEFISVVSHELRTPLTPVTGILTLLARDPRDELSEESRRMVDLGLRNSRRLLKLIDDLLDMQNLSLSAMEFNFEQVDVAELASDAVQLNEPLGDAKNITFHLHLDDQRLFIRGDRERLMQVVTNLLSNAVKFSEPDSRVDISVSREDPHVILSITDYGSGIPEEARERIFEKFVQADSSLTRRYGGAGLGLTISKAIIDRLGGEIRFETKRGEGTTFFVELPLSEDAE